MFSRLRDRATPFRQTDVKTQGQLNGNKKVARSEYESLDVLQQRPLSLYKRNRIGVELANFANKKKMAGKYCAPASRPCSFDRGRGEAHCRQPAKKASYPFVVLFKTSSILVVTQKLTVKDCVKIPKSVNENRPVTNYELQCKMCSERLAVHRPP